MMREDAGSTSKKPVNGAHPGAVVVAVLAQRGQPRSLQEHSHGDLGIGLTFLSEGITFGFLRVLGQDGQVCYSAHRRKR